MERIKTEKTLNQKKIYIIIKLIVRKKIKIITEKNQKQNLNYFRRKKFMNRIMIMS